MTFDKLKIEVKNLNLEKHIDNFQGFDEYDTDDFNIVFAMLDAPGYIIAQFKINEEKQQSDKTWFVAIPMNGKVCVIDTGTEEEMCDQFYDLVFMITIGFGTVGVREKKENTGEITIK